SEDPNPPSLALLDHQDRVDHPFYAFIPPEVIVPEKLTEPQVVVDTLGVPHLFWLQGGEIWHAYQEAGQWISAQPIDGAAARDFSVTAAPNLLDGTDPGIILTWEGGGGTNGSNVLY